MRLYARELCLGVLLSLITGSVWAGPSISCSGTTWDFGVISGTNSIEHTYLIRNTGDEPLTIGECRACCGATTSMNNTNILPGTAAEMKVVVSLQRRMGAVNMSLYVKSNDPLKPYYQLRVVGSIVESGASNLNYRVHTIPESVDFGQIGDNVTNTTRFEVFVPTNAMLNITGVVSSVSWFQLEWAPTLAPGINPGRGTGIIRTAPPLLPGLLKGVVKVLTDDPDTPNLELPVRAVVLGDVLTVPGDITLNEDATNVVTRFLAIRSRSGSQFKIEKIELPQKGIETSIEPLAGGGYKIRLSSILVDKELDGKEIVILTDHEKMKRILVPIRVMKKP